MSTSHWLTDLLTSDIIRLQIHFALCILMSFFKGVGGVFLAFGTRMTFIVAFSFTLHTIFLTLRSMFGVSRYIATIDSYIGCWLPWRVSTVSISISIDGIFTVNITNFLIYRLFLPMVPLILFKGSLV